MREVLPFTYDELKKWRTEYNTPFYVYDQVGIEETVRRLQSAFSWNKGYKEYFAVKATPTPGILRLLKNLGCGFDCASSAEVYLALKSGAKEKDIMFTSNETQDEEYKDALEAKGIINLDDFYQIEKLEKGNYIPVTICLRFNPGKFELSSSIMGHLYDSKFGMNEEQIIESIKLLKEKGVKHFGIHGMFSGNSLDENYYPNQAKILFKLVVKIKELLGIEIEFVDFGGGIGIPYKPEETAVDIETIGLKVKEAYDEILKANNLEVSIFTELARFITGPHGYLVTSVVGKKSTYRDYIGLDASACDLMRPAMYGAYHHIVVAGKDDKPYDHKYDLVGSLCENNDKFAIERNLPEIEIDDIVVIEDAGAHGRSMGYNYNGKMRCGELLMDKNHQIRMIRRKETLKDYFSTLDIDEEFND